MSRLIAFGDSFTYGDGLADCHVEPTHPGPVAHLQAAEKLYEIINAPK